MARSAFAVVLAAIPAAHSLAAISGTTLRVTATNDMGTGFVEFDAGMGWFDDAGNYQWELAGPVAIMTQGGVELATLTEADVRYTSNPSANVFFAVQAAAGGGTTTFSVDSGLLPVPSSFANVEGRATASLTLTDIDGAGASISAVPGAASIFSAQYDGLVPNGTVFADLLVGPYTLPATGNINSTTVAASLPAGLGLLSISPDPANISAGYRFELSAGDLASGTASFRIIPAPASAALLSLGGLLATRRRR